MDRDMGMGMGLGMGLSSFLISALKVCPPGCSGHFGIKYDKSNKEISPSTERNNAREIDLDSETSK